MRSAIDIGRSSRGAKAAKAAKGPLTAFRAAAKKVERMIAELEAGGDYRASYDALPTFRAINKLEDRANKPEIRGDDAIREEAWAIVKELRQRTRDAEPIGRAAIQRARDSELGAIKQREADRVLSLSPADRQYQKELSLLRGSR